jgi:hypothetical protein
MDRINQHHPHDSINDTYETTLLNTTSFTSAFKISRNVFAFP